MAQVVDTTIERNVGLKILCVYYAVDTNIHRVVNVESNFADQCSTFVFTY